MKKLFNLSYKTLFIIVILLLIAIIFLVKIGSKTKKVSASWWNDSWHYRQVINISSHSSNESDVYIITTINIGSTDKVQNDDGDFRFINESGDILPYYISSGTGTTSIVFHIQLESFPSGAQTIYAYYGNSTAENGFSDSDFSTEASNYSIGSYSSEEAGGNPVAYWKFDEGSGTTAYNSTGSINGTLSGSTLPTWADGKSNNGIALSGVGDYISLPYKPNFREAMTVSIWMKRTTDFNQLTDVMFLSPANAWYFYDSYNSGNVRGDVYIDGVRKGGINVPVPFDGNWYQITYTYDSATHFAKMYKNGTLYKSLEITGLSNYLIDAATGNLYNFGRNTLGRGLILDEAKIYSYARTADQILQDYNSRGSSSGSSVNLGIRSSSTNPDTTIQFGSATQTIGGTTTSLAYCIPGDTTYCASPIAEWNFEENIGNTVIDTSGNNNTGTLSTGTYAPNWTTGKNNIGAGIKFNGESNSSYISTTYPSTTPPTSYTTEAWIKPTKVSGTGDHSTYGYTIMAASVGASRYPVWITIHNGEIRSYTFSNSAGTYFETINTNILANQWYHIAISATQNGTATIYVNGIGKTSFPVGSTEWNISDKLTIGDLRPGRNISFNGIIDEVKVYDYIRTPAQIAYDYNKGAPIAWWKLDECEGSIAHDSSGIGNTGIISIGQNGTQNSLGTCSIGTSAAWTNGSNGHINASLNFDGTDDHINMGNGTVLNMYSNFSVSTWVKPNVTNTYQRILTKSNPPSGQDYGYSLAGRSNGKFWGVIHTANGYFGTSDSTASMTTSWTHLALTYNGSHLLLYINGILDKDTTVTGGDITYDTGNLYIGCHANEGSERFNGQIDDIRVYNYALTPEQIKTIYNNGAVNFQ